MCKMLYISRRKRFPIWLPRAWKPISISDGGGGSGVKMLKILNMVASQLKIATSQPNRSEAQTEPPLGRRVLRDSVSWNVFVRGQTDDKTCPWSNLIYLLWRQQFTTLRHWRRISFCNLIDVDSYHKSMRKPTLKTPSFSERFHNRLKILEADLSL